MTERAVRICFHTAFWLPLALCTWLALMPESPDAVAQISDIILHLGAFLWLTFALRFAFPALGRGAAGLLMLGYGALLEVLQGLGGVRMAELGDLAVDAAAILVALAVYRLIGARVRAVVEQVVRSLVR